ncbi:unnamed protein product [Mycena citricolor]|uniref:Transmembrane protein 14 n=1 Tax=Mycena citricolor TaxID=2018698 RepID=A0AAD2Q262_9AGAR|nr:unnamed protein product [Mycena citricolor]
MSAYPAFAMGGLCMMGGVAGFARTRSVPSLAAGLGVGALYMWAGDRIRRGQPNGLEGAIGASAVLFLSSAPRLRRGGVPIALTSTSAMAGLYYAKTVYGLSQQQLQIQSARL